MTMHEAFRDFNRACSGVPIFSVCICSRGNTIAATRAAMQKDGGGDLGVLDALKLNLPQISDIPHHLLGGLPWIAAVLMLIASAVMRSNAPRTLVT
jgi:general nucleoside transport system permease protein